MTNRFAFLVAAMITLSGCPEGKKERRDAGTDAGVDAGADDASMPDAGDPCVGEGACWQCAPTEARHFLNGCTEAQCSPFDNAARIPGFVP